RLLRRRRSCTEPGTPATRFRHQCPERSCRLRKLSDPCRRFEYFPSRTSAHLQILTLFRHRPVCPGHLFFLLQPDPQSLKDLPPRTASLSRLLSRELSPQPRSEPPLHRQCPAHPR